jgi:flagellar biosynthesis/type III secretory pathway protein FliH
MKRVFFVATIISAFAVFSSFTATKIEKVDLFENPFQKQTNYQKGWEEGYCEGWKDVKGKNAYCNHAPYPNNPQYPKSSDSFRDGYNDGFKRGTSDAQK